ncbi:uncharacterized protein Triagg1_8201 [Trichoderma aggressivum f. europaeum]|uniref:Uncharacterized protein n=1 Tax=Trichoderma aggressivum f. europaeum TaxID=173218 RepID=A0AAE1IAU7_9HYPO|nr:hypothetical protein Triagg1_8201 [Trichoderma aggressivum f. europaeum]
MATEFPAVTDNDGDGFVNAEETMKHLDRRQMLLDKTGGAADDWTGSFHVYMNINDVPISTPGPNNVQKFSSTSSESLDATFAMHNNENDFAFLGMDTLAIVVKIVHRDDFARRFLGFWAEADTNLAGIGIIKAKVVSGVKTKLDRSKEGKHLLSQIGEISAQTSQTQDKRPVTFEILFNALNSYQIEGNHHQLILNDVGDLFIRDLTEEETEELRQTDHSPRSPEKHQDLPRDFRQPKQPLVLVTGVVEPPSPQKTFDGSVLPEPSEAQLAQSISRLALLDNDRLEPKSPFFRHNSALHIQPLERRQPLFKRKPYSTPTINENTPCPYCSEQTDCVNPLTLTGRVFTAGSKASADAVLKSQSEQACSLLDADIIRQIHKKQSPLSSDIEFGETVDRFHKARVFDDPKQSPRSVSSSKRASGGSSHVSEHPSERPPPRGTRPACHQLRHVNWTLIYISRTLSKTPLTSLPASASFGRTRGRSRVTQEIINGVESDHLPRVVLPGRELRRRHTSPTLGIDGHLKQKF